MLLNAKQILISELTLAENSSKEAIEETVNAKINTSFEEYSKLHGINEGNNVVKKFISFDSVSGPTE